MGGLTLATFAVALAAFISADRTGREETRTYIRMPVPEGLAAPDPWAGLGRSAVRMAVLCLCVGCRDH